MSRCVQEPREAKRHRGDEAAADAAASTSSGPEEQAASVAAMGDGPAVPMEATFASAGAQDVNAINETGDTLAETSAPPQQPQVLLPLPLCHLLPGMELAMVFLGCLRATCLSYIPRYPQCRVLPSRLRLLRLICPLYSVHLVFLTK